MFRIPDPESFTGEDAEVALNVYQNEEGLRNLRKALKLLSDEIRLRIVLMISSGSMNVTDMCERLGMSQPAVSHHLAILRAGGMIESEIDGKYHYYSLKHGCKSLDEVIRLLTAFSVSSAPSQPKDNDQKSERSLYGIEGKLAALNAFAQSLLPEDLLEEWRTVWTESNCRILRELIHEGFSQYQCKAMLRKQISEMLSEPEESQPEA